MNIAHYAKAIAGVLPSIIGLLVVILRDRLGISLSEAEVQLLYIVLGAVGIGTGAAVFTVPNKPK